MTAPAYHLRPNKAVDRHLLMEAIGYLAEMDGDGLKGYTYHGFGGPYLEDFRLLYERYPEIRMVSIEEDGETFKRQKFHCPCSTLELTNQSMSEFIERYDPGDGKGIFWLDYNDLDYCHFNELHNLLEAVPDGSMIKVTLRARPADFWTEGMQRLNGLGREFVDKFDGIMPNPSAPLPKSGEGLASLLQGMVRIVAQKALPPNAGGGKFVPVSSFRYSDGTPMFTLTGVVCKGDREDRLEGAFGDWYFANLSWRLPLQINVPVLSTKERLRLQPLLPKAKSGKDLRKELGYSIDSKCERADDALMQYARFHRHAPYFLKGVP